MDFAIFKRRQLLLLRMKVRMKEILPLNLSESEMR